MSASDSSRAGVLGRRLRMLAAAAGGMAVTLTYGLAGARLGAGAPLILLGMGGVALGLCGLALYRVIEPLLRPEEAARAEAASTPVRLRELEREKQLVLKAIREIEHDYQMRRINEADYKAMSERYRVRAMRLMKEIDAGDDYRGVIEGELKVRLAALPKETAAEAAPAVSALPTCPGCGTANDADAQFCKKCGKAMPAAGKAGA